MRTLLSLLLILLSLASASFSLSTPLQDTNSLDADTTCEYTILVKTGTFGGAGTNAVVSLTLAGGHRLSGNLTIANLESWGAMAPGHDYFENGNLDTFRGNSQCLTEEICWMFLRHNNGGYRPGWYVEYVDVYTRDTTSGSIGHQKFLVNQWLALSEPPYRLFAERNYCKGEGVEDQIIMLNSQV